MLDMRFIRENLDEAERRLRTRGGDSYLDGFRELDERRRALLRESESLKALRNAVSEEIARIKDKSQAQGKILEMREVSQRIKAMDEDLTQVDEELNRLLLMVPNLPDPATPVGASEQDNVELRSWGSPLPSASPPSPTGKSASSWAYSTSNAVPSSPERASRCIVVPAPGWNVP